MFIKIGGIKIYRKHVFIFVLLIMLIGMISAVSAVDMNQNDTVAIEDINDDVVAVEGAQKSIGSDEIIGLGVSENSEILATNYTPQTFSEIQASVDSANGGDTIILRGQYIFTSTVNVTKQLNFVGQNDATVDGGNSVGLFMVSNRDVTFKNIAFKNGKSNYGAAIYCSSYMPCSALNCTFVNNSADYSGGAMYHGSALNCTFVNNSASDYGGAMYSGSALNCIFINNTAVNAGGATYSGDAVNCLFINNSNSYSGLDYNDWGGGAMNRGSALNCTFYNNYAYLGGAMSMGSALNCTFVNNSAEYGGAINCQKTIVNCTFVNNSAYNSGGAITGAVNSLSFFSDFRSFAENCTFYNNTAWYGGAMYRSSAVKCSFVNNSATTGGAMYDSSAVKCSFVNNSATNGGAIGGGNVTDCSFVNNSAADAGGAIYDIDCVFNCTFVKNSAKYGGAIKGSYYGGGPPTYHSSSIENCTFINNSAIYGGAITAGDNIVDSIFINNSATFGGSICGVYEITYYSGLNMIKIGNYFSHVNNCTFYNSSADYGGAMYDGNAINCTFIGCSAGYGGAIFIENRRNFTNCNFTNCFADNQGGAVYLNQSANVTECNFINCTSGESNSCLVCNSSATDYIIQNCIFDVVPENVKYHYVSSLAAENLTFFNGEEGILIANLSYFKGILSNQKVTFSVNGNDYTNFTDENGVARLDVADYIKKGGIYDFTINFAGDEIINPASATATVTINVHESILNTSDEIEIYKNQYGYVTAKLYNVRGPIADKQVKFTVKGVTTKSYKTNSEGIVEFGIFNYINDLGKYEVNIAFEGDDYNQPVSQNVNVYYINYNGTLTCSVDGKYFNDTILTFSLINNKNQKPISDASIKLKFSNDVVEFITTDVDGIATYRIPFKPDTYDVVANVNDSFVRVNNITVSDIEINKIFGVIEHYLTNGNRTLNLRLYSQTNSDVFRNVRIKLVFSNGNETEIITGGDGIASYDIPFSKGVYSVQASVLGEYRDFDDDYIKNIVISNTLNCTVNFTNDIVFDFGGYGSTNYTIDGGNIESAYVIGHSEAIVSINNNVITVFGLYPGNYTLLVATAPDNYHNQLNYTLNISVHTINPKVSFSADIVFEYGSSSSIYVTVDGGSILKENIAVVNCPDAVIDFANDLITISGLDVGKYNLTVVTTPDEGYNSITASVGFTVKEVDSDIIFSNEIEFTQGESGSTTVTAIGCEEDFGAISVVNYPNAGIHLENNVITVSGLTFGNYKLRIDTNPDKNHKSVSRTLNITVYKMLSSLTFDGDLVFDYGSSGNTKINVNGGSVLPSGISVVDHSEANILLNSNNEIYVSNLNAGEYTLSVETTPDDTHRPVKATLPIVVNKVKSSLSFGKDILSYNYGDSGSTSVIVDGGNVSKVTISIVGHPYAKITLIDNLIYISDLDSGSYELEVATIPDSNHISVTNRVGVTVGKAKSKIDFTNDIVFDYGSSGSTTLILDGCKVELSNITVIGHPKAVLGINSNNVVTVSGLDAGNYTLNVNTISDDNHISNSRTVGITVNKIDSTVLINNPILFDYGGLGSTNFTVSGGSSDINKIIVVDHPEANITLKNDVISVSNLDVGTYTLRVTSIPDANHNSVSKTTDITVNKVDSHIAFDSNIITFDYGSFGFVGVTMVGANLLDSEIVVLNHKEIKPAINGNIVAVSGLNAGNYTLRVTSSPDANHNSVSKDIDVSVNKIDSSISCDNNIVFDYGASGSASVTVVGGNIINGSAIVIGNPNAVVRVNNNFVTVSNLTFGTYTLKITSNPDRNHEAVSTTASISVNKVNSKVEFSNPIVFDYLSEGTTTLRLDGCTVDLNNISVVGHDEAVISKNNKGVIAISNLSAGNYILKVVTIPDANHKSSTANLDIKVNKIDSKISFTKSSISFKYTKYGSTPIVLENCKVASMSIVGKNVKPVLKNNVIRISGLNVGKYVLKVTTVPDNKNYNPVTRYIDVSVTKNIAKISVKTKSFAYKSGDKWTITLKDSSGAPIAGMKVSIKVFTGKKAKVYKKTTNSKGVIKFPASTLSIGKHKVVLSISHSGYTCKPVTSSVKVIKPIILKFKSIQNSVDKFETSLSYMVFNKNTNKGINGVNFKCLIYTGKKYDTHILKTKRIKGKSGEVYNGAIGFITNQYSLGKHVVKLIPIGIKYKGSVTTKITIKKSDIKGKFFRVI